MSSPLESVAVVNNEMIANSGLLSLLSSSDAVSKIVILILFTASIWSWTIIIGKFFLLRYSTQKIRNFEKMFWSGQVLDKLYESIKDSVDNPLAAVFVSAMHECKKTLRGSVDGLLKVGQKERVFQSMSLVRDREMERLESGLAFLATVGSSSTFIGLFGTVWGIMNSFSSIASAKNTSLAVVAPGIAEALFATAIGLAVAIPAVIFHSYLMNNIITINNKIDDFIGELSTLLSRAIDEDKI